MKRMGGFGLRRPSVKSILLASLAAVALSLAQPVLLVFCINICITPILIALLYAWAGWIPAILASAGTVGMLAGMGGSLPSMMSRVEALGKIPGITGGMSAEIVAAVARVMGAVNDVPFSGAVAGGFALCGLIALVLPGWVSILMLRRRRPFYQGLLTAVGTQIIMLTAVVCLCYLGYRVDLAERVIGFMRGMADITTQSAQLQLIDNFYLNGLLTREAYEKVATGIVTSGDIKTLLNQGFDNLAYQLRLRLPSLLLTSGLATGLFLHTLPSLVCVRRGDEPQVDYHPISDWRLPARAVTGILVCVATGFILQLMQVEGAAVVTMTIMQVAQMLCMVQGAAALSRRFKETGISRGKRIALIAAGVLLAGGFIAFLGAASALLGRKGMITAWMKRKAKERQMDENSGFMDMDEEDEDDNDKGDQ